MTATALSDLVEREDERATDPAIACFGRDDTPLRELSEAEFRARYGADQFTMAMLASRFRYVMKHMSTGLLNTAFSMILRDWYDFATTLSGPPEMGYAMSTGSDSMLMFMGTMPDGVRNTIEEFGPENLQPGDLIVANDPYRVGLHVNDVAFIRPLFHEGRLISFLALRAHQLDIGGVVPAGFSATKANVYETGLVISPTLIYRDNKPVRSAFNLIFDNARYCSLLLPDIKSIHQSLKLGEQLLMETIGRYGIDAYLGAIRYSCDVAADAMREAIRTRIPDGSYEGEDIIDADGIDDSLVYRVKVRITKAGDNLEVDFSGTSQQARTSINCGPLDVKATVGVALKMLIEQETPFASGTYRNIDIIIPPATICSATPPDGPVFIYWEALSAVILSVYRALADVLGADAVAGDFGSLMVHNANGLSKDGVPWVTAAQCGGEHGPWGASKAGDGDSYNVLQITNNIDPAIEAIESDAPVVVLRRDYVPDTAGAGVNRGGAAVLKDTLWLTAAEHSTIGPLHSRLASGTGVHGGTGGTGQASWVFPPEAFDVAAERALLPTDPAIYARSKPMGGMLDPVTKRLDAKGEYVYFAGEKVLKTTPGTFLRYQTGGGGGWGDPLARDPERVMRDVRDEYISIEGALRDYGVVVKGDPVNHPEKLEIDRAATEQRRREMAGGR
jgi:N-methylhydantoinase B